MVLLLRKKAGENLGMRRTYFRSGPLPDRASSGHVTDLTSGQKALLGRIWHNFRLPMCRTYFRTGHLRSRHFRLHSLTAPPQMLTDLYPYTTHVIPLSNDIWYRCVAHGFITFDFLTFYSWSIRKGSVTKCNNTSLAIQPIWTTASHLQTTTSHIKSLNSTEKTTYPNGIKILG